ncbi:hypothetical protein, partial [Flavobacterium sp. CGRL2]
MKHILFFILLLLLFVGCKSKKDLNSTTRNSVKKELSNKEMQTWYQKDLVLDGILGISLDKWYASNK